MIDKFSKEQFEQALFNIHPGHERLGLVSGEEVYTIPVNGHTRLTVRSSIDRAGYAADSGEDSIRLWLEVYQPVYHNPNTLEWVATSRKVDAYTTRVEGWQNRLESKIRILWDRAVKVRKLPGLCDCDKAANVYFVKKDSSNQGRPFQSCRDCDFFEWLDIIPTFKIDFETEDVLPIEPVFDFETVFDEPQPKLEFEPSPYQKAIFSWVETETGHGICQAVAGSGKTTTN